MSRSAGTAGSITGAAKITRSRIQTVVTDEERSRSFEARYDGKPSPLCLRRIWKGQQIFYRSGTKPMHVTCPP
jgi:hypothetical protein